MYEGQRDVRTIAAAQWCSLGRLHEASMFGRASRAPEVDRATTVPKQLSVQSQYVMRAPMDRGDWSKYCSLWVIYEVHNIRTVEFLLLETVESGDSLSRERQLLRRRGRESDSIVSRL